MNGLRSRVREFTMRIVQKLMGVSIRLEIDQRVQDAQERKIRADRLEREQQIMKSMKGGKA